MKLKNKVALITGASTGIGRAIAVAFAKEGARVIITARSEEGLNKTYELMKQDNNERMLITCDLRNIQSISGLTEDIKKEYGKLDILVNTAGIYHSDDKAYSSIDFTDYTTDEILNTFEVGINTPTLLAHQLIPLMEKDSKIINISGTFESGAKGWLPYYVSKKALENLTVGLAQELRDKQIQVNCISPSDTLTESYQKFFPKYATQDNCLKPEEVANLAIFLVSNEADNITGQIIVIKNKLVK